MLSKNALGNMQKRYSAVLTKCRLLNAFGSLAMVTMLGLGGLGGFGGLGGLVGEAWAYTLPTSGDVVIGNGDSVTLSENHTATGDTTISGGSLTVNGGTYTTDWNTIICETGSLTVNTGGLYNTGSANADWVTKAIQSAGLAPKNLAIFAISKANALVVQNEGKISVGTTTNSPNMNFGTGSLLVVDAGGLNGKTALQAERIIATDGAALLVSNVKFDRGSATVNIADAGELSIDNTWGSSSSSESEYPNLYFDNGLIAVDSINWGDETSYSLILKQISAATVFVETKLSPELENLLDKANVNGALPQYLGSATNLGDKAMGATIIESAAKMAVSAGVFHAAMSVAGLGMDAVEGRTDLSLFMSKSAALGYTVDSDTGSFYASNNEVVSDAIVSDAVVSDATTPQIPDRMMNGLALWAQPMFQSVSAHGLSSGNFSYGYDTDIYGASLGADYTVHNDTRFGLALHIGNGQSESNQSELSYTENDFDFVGASLYAGYLFNNLGLSANIGYTVTTNDVNQKTILGSIYTDDFDTSVFSAGARAEYKLATDFMNIVPYVGARLNYFRMDSFDVKTATETVYHTAETHATTFAIPLGVTLSKGMAYGDVKLMPWASLGMQWTMGDLDVAQRISIPGVAGSESLASEIFDPVTFMGGLGLDVNVDNVSFGLEYHLGASEHVMSHQLGAKVEYRF